MGSATDLPRVLAVTNMYPTLRDPTYGVFIATQMESIAASGVPVSVQFINGRRGMREYIRGLFQVRRRARTEDFDLVHAHYGLSGFVSAFQPLPLVVSFCGDDILGTPNGKGGLTAKSRMVRRLSYAVLRRADAIICKSEEMKRALPRSCNRERVHVIPNGVDVTRFRPGDRLAARQILNLDPGARLILFPSTPSERRKRLDLAEAAVLQLAAYGLPAKLWVVQGVPPVDMPNYFRAADSLLLTSDWEGSPNVVKEAICCDLPVVSVNAGDASVWIRMTPGCRIVDRDPAAIARGLEEVLASRRSVDGGPVRRELALELVAQRVIAVYRDVLAGTHARWTGPGAKGPGSLWWGAFRR